MGRGLHRHRHRALGRNAHRDQRPVLRDHQQASVRQRDHRTGVLQLRQDPEEAPRRQVEGEVRPVGDVAGAAQGADADALGQVVLVVGRPIAAVGDLLHQLAGAVEADQAPVVDHRVELDRREPIGGPVAEELGRQGFLLGCLQGHRSPHVPDLGTVDRVAAAGGVQQGEGQEGLRLRRGHQVASEESFTIDRRPFSAFALPRLGREVELEVAAQEAGSPAAVRLGDPGVAAGGATGAPRHVGDDLHRLEVDDAEAAGRVQVEYRAVDARRARAAERDLLAPDQPVVLEVVAEQLVLEDHRHQVLPHGDLASHVRAADPRLGNLRAVLGGQDQQIDLAPAPGQDEDPVAPHHRRRTQLPEIGSPELVRGSPHRFHVDRTVG